MGHLVRVFGIQQADVLAGAVIVLVALGQFAGNLPVLNLGSVILDVGQNRFAGAIDAAQVQTGVQVVGMTQLSGCSTFWVRVSM